MAARPSPAKKPARKPPIPKGRRLIVQTFVSLDGVMQAPGGPDEDRDGGFRHGGWSMTYWDEKMGKTMGERMAETKDLLLGRRTYDIFAGYWPKHPDEPGADKLNGAKKYVASRTRRTVEWQNSTLLDKDVPSAIRKLKQRPGRPISVSGSSDLIQTLLAHDLVDELDLWIFPVVLGAGKRLFGKGTIPSAWKLTDSRQSTTGVLIQRYQRAGDIRYGAPLGT